MNLYYISIIGLVLDIVGFMMIFRNGFFSNKQFQILVEIFKESSKQTLRITSEEPNISKIVELTKTSKKYSNIAFALVIIGFTLQIIGTIITNHISI
jgi:ascorbate-specific PTS system EIIC-type component UlaA